MIQAINQIKTLNAVTVACSQPDQEFQIQKNTVLDVHDDTKLPRGVYVTDPNNPQRKIWFNSEEYEEVL